ncbi:MAG: ABC transporter permease [Deltaproteobacteria bacterium]|nr:ABC transporter permease [Deltaproteobacteria bacterium]
MKFLFTLTLQSIAFRKTTVGLSLFSIMISVTLLVGVNRLRVDAKQSFQNTISNIDLIVGAKTGASQLLLSTVFHQGFPSNNISYRFFTSMQQKQDVAFAIPISLGDSHRGFRVIGTSKDFFQHFKYGNKQQLTLTSGQTFASASDVVVGYHVAKKLGYHIGDNIVVAHGMGETSFDPHDDHPFTIVGILKPTGTPVDKAVYVSLQAIEKIHLENHESADDMEQLKPISITAMFIGLKNKVAIFGLQRAINEYKKEPLLAIIPGLTFYEIWNLVAVAEKALWIISIFVFIAGMLGLLTLILTSMRERTYEIAVLRSQGATPRQIAWLFVIESTFLTVVGSLLGLFLLWLLILAFGGILQPAFGISLTFPISDPKLWKIIGSVCIAGFVIGWIPAIMAYRKTLQQGLTPA